MSSRPKCIGVWGRLFGHKFYGKRTHYVQDFCLRCGLAHD